jgi:hypothetical protein
MDSNLWNGQHDLGWTAGLGMDSRTWDGQHDLGWTFRVIHLNCEAIDVVVDENMVVGPRNGDGCLNCMSRTLFHS